MTSPSGRVLCGTAAKHEEEVEAAERAGQAVDKAMAACAALDLGKCDIPDMNGAVSALDPWPWPPSPSTR
eukprot:5889889-Alexandrium_andersonii.AAC.1